MHTIVIIRKRGKKKIQGIINKIALKTLTKKKCGGKIKSNYDGKVFAYALFVTTCLRK